MTSKLNPIRQIRDAIAEARGRTVTQADFARELGISRSLVNALETKASRPISDDVKGRILETYGISIAPSEIISYRGGDQKRLKETDTVAKRAVTGPVCIAAPELPLAEGLRKHWEQTAILDAAAMGTFDREEIANIRAALLAAQRVGKAARVYFAVENFTSSLVHDLGLWEEYQLAKKEIALHGGNFPPGTTRDDLAGNMLLAFRGLQTRATNGFFAGADQANALIEEALQNPAANEPTQRGSAANVGKGAIAEATPETKAKKKKPKPAKRK